MPPCLAHVFPEIALVFVTVELHAFEVAAGDNSKDLAGSDQWNVAESAIHIRRSASIAV